MKGVLHPDHIPKNKYRLIISGMPGFTFTKVGGIEEEIEKIDLPDRTGASGGNTKNGEFTATIATHHRIERVALENWYGMCKGTIAPNYKKSGTLVKSSLSNIQHAVYMIQGIFPFKRTTEDLEMENEGELDVIEWTFSFDSIIAR